MWSCFKNWNRRNVLFGFFGVVASGRGQSRNLIESTEEKLEIRLIDPLKYLSPEEKSLFKVVLIFKNISNNPICFIKTNNSWGVCSISLKLTDESGVTHTLQRHPGNFRRNFPSLEELESGESAAVILQDDGWWRDLPEVIGGFSLCAEFAQSSFTDKIFKPDPSKQWTGRVVSNQISINK